MKGIRTNVFWFPENVRRMEKRVRGRRHTGGIKERLSLLSELCADFIMSAAARRSSLIGGGAPPVPNNHCTLLHLVKLRVFNLTRFLETLGLLKKCVNIITRYKCGIYRPAPLTHKTTHVDANVRTTTGEEL